MLMAYLFFYFMFCTQLSISLWELLKSDRSGVPVPYPHHVDADTDPAFHFDADPDPTFYSDVDLDPDPAINLMWIRIRILPLISFQIWTLQSSKRRSKASNFSL
jgi:hypothetical protein